MRSSSARDDLNNVSPWRLKLEHALKHWQIDVAEKVCLDVGLDWRIYRFACCSTVPPRDCGRHRYGQMDFKLRQDPRVRLLEKTNARYVTRKYC